MENTNIKTSLNVRSKEHCLSIENIIDSNDMKLPTATVGTTGGGAPKHTASARWQNNWCAMEW